MGLGSYLFLANIYCHLGVIAITNKDINLTKYGVYTRTVGDQAIYGGILLIFVGLYFGYKYLQPVLEQRSLLLEKRNIIPYIKKAIMLVTKIETRDDIWNVAKVIYKISTKFANLLMLL